MKIFYLNQGLKEYYDKELADKDTIIDVKIKKWINLINQYPFIRTTQCCEGHPDNGYLSVMIAKEYVQWFETVVVAALVFRGYDIIKRYERLKNIIIARYIFWFSEDTRDSFFSFLFKALKEKTEGKL